MSSTRTQHLRAAYLDAFAQWALQIRRLQAFAGSNGLTAQEARKRADQAEAAYRTSRDRLAKALANTTETYIETRRSGAA